MKLVLLHQNFNRIPDGSLNPHNLVSRVVRILWFKETTRWSRRGMPLRVVWVSPRQLAILLFSFLFGFSPSVPLPTQTLKLAALGSSLLAGAVVSFWRVKMLTPEQLIVAKLRGLTRIPQRGEKRAAGDKTSSAEQYLSPLLQGLKIHLRDPRRDRLLLELRKPHTESRQCRKLRALAG